jgi:hypothetical protein
VKVERRKENFMQGIKDNGIAITGASSESIRPPRRAG